MSSIAKVTVDDVVIMSLATGERGREGKSTYDLYVDSTTDSPKLTLQEWIARDAAKITTEIADARYELQYTDKVSNLLDDSFYYYGKRATADPGNWIITRISKSDTSLITKATTGAADLTAAWAIRASLIYS